MKNLLLKTRVFINLCSNTWKNKLILNQTFPMRRIMRQENPFFSSKPQFFFGSHQNLDDEEDQDFEKYFETEQIFFGPHRYLPFDLRIDLFLHWSDANE